MTGVLRMKQKPILANTVGIYISESKETIKKVKKIDKAREDFMNRYEALVKAKKDQKIQKAAGSNEK